MVRVSPASRSASSGELSELMFGRPDFARFQNGARACRGFMTLPEGPVTRLPGTRFMGFTKDDQPARLMPFVFRDEDAVLLEWTNSLLRFWRDGQLVLDGPSPYELATPYTETEVAELQSLQSADRIYLAGGNKRPHRLSRFDLTNWSIEPTPFKGGPFASRNIDETKEFTVSGVAGTVTLSTNFNFFEPHHVDTLIKLWEVDASDTPYWTADAPASIGDRVYYNGLAYQIVAFDNQSGKTGSAEPAIDMGPPVTVGLDGYVIWEAVAPGNSGDDPTWTSNTLVKVGDRRHLPVADYTVQCAGFAGSNPAGGWISIPGFSVIPQPPPINSKKTGPNPPIHKEGFWLSEKGGVVWRALHDGTGVLKITSIIDAQNAEAVVQTRMPDGLVDRATYRWAEQAWNDVRGWPRAIGAYEQRHIYGGGKSEPRTLWHGVVGGTVDFTSGANDDDGFSYILPNKSDEVGEIRAITSAGELLFVMTSADEVFGRGVEGDRAFSRNTAKYTSDTSVGATDTMPVIVGGAPVFVSKTMRRLITLLVDTQTGRFKAENLTQIARHILGPGCTKIVYVEDPVPIIWGRLDNGELMGLTYIPGQQVVGFHRHNLAGGYIEDIARLPGENGRTQHLWLIVRREINGITRRCIERLEQPFVDLDGSDPPVKDAWHQFCATRYEGAPSAEITGLDHLEGEVVTAWTDRGAFTELQVSGGLVTLPQEVTSAIVGLDATDQQYFDTLDIVIGQPDGGDDGRLRTHRASGVRVHRTAGGTFQVIGKTSGKEVRAEPEPIINLDAFQVPEALDGIFEIGGQKGWDHQAHIRFQPSPGAPMTIVGRTPTMMLTDG